MLCCSPVGDTGEAQGHRSLGDPNNGFYGKRWMNHIWYLRIRGKDILLLCLRHLFLQNNLEENSYAHCTFFSLM